MANRSGARPAIIIGEDEVRHETCTVKRMDSGEQEEVAREKLAERLDAILHPKPSGRLNEEGTFTTL